MEQAVRPGRGPRVAKSTTLSLPPDPFSLLSTVDSGMHPHRINAGRIVHIERKDVGNAQAAYRDMIWSLPVDAGQESPWPACQAGRQAHSAVELSESMLESRSFDSFNPLVKPSSVSPCSQSFGAPQASERGPCPSTRILPSRMLGLPTYNAALQSSSIPAMSISQLLMKTVRLWLVRSSIFGLQAHHQPAAPRIAMTPALLR